MIRKGVYPYVHMGDREKFEETSLPPKDAFYSRLNMKGISDQDYEHAQQVWNTTEKKDPRLLSRYILENRCIVVSGRVRNISEHMLRKLQIGSSTFLHRTRISMAGLNKDSRWVLWAWKKAQRLWIIPRWVQAWAAYEHEHAVDGWKMYSGQGLPRQLSVMPRLIIRIWKVYTTPMKIAYMFSTWMQTTFTDGQWFKIYQHIDFYGRMQRTLPLKK